MSKRLQVVVDDAEYLRIKRAARGSGITVSEWVRNALRDARREVAGDSKERKLATIRAAAAHAVPTSDIDQMLAEIGSGYGAGA
jgi:cell wall-associated NlpC family hydrolase